MKRRPRNVLIALAAGLLPMLLVIAPAQVAPPDPWEPQCTTSCLACHFHGQVGCT